jgi:hypothetical protein
MLALFFIFGLLSSLVVNVICYILVFVSEAKYERIFIISSFFVLLSCCLSWLSLLYYKVWG